MRQGLLLQSLQLQKGAKQLRQVPLKKLLVVNLGEPRTTWLKECKTPDTISRPRGGTVASIFFPPSCAQDKGKHTFCLIHLFQASGPPPSPNWGEGGGPTYPPPSLAPTFLADPILDSKIFFRHRADSGKKSLESIALVQNSFKTSGRNNKRLI